MPTRYLTNADDFNSIEKWLEANLSNNNSIKACAKFLDKVPTKKGIYFWFMKNDAYEQLSNFVTINPIDKRITWGKFDLVYIGVTGEKGKGTGQLNQRLTEHITEHPNNSRLTTLRKGISALLADHLIEPNTEQLVNEFLCNNMIVYWVQFEKDKIASNEKILISILRPLLNSDHNPNKKITNNPTKIYSERRNIVIKNSIESNKKTKSKTKHPKNNGVAAVILYDGCVEFFVLQNQRIDVVANAIPNLPVGPCTIQIFDAITGAVVFRRMRTIRTKGRTVGQYFSASNDKTNTPKWRVVQNEMITREIEKIRVIVCPE